MEKDTSLVVWYGGQTTAKLSLPYLKHYRPNSDIILVWALDTTTVPVKTTQDGQFSFLEKEFQTGDELVISDCKHTEIFQWKKTKPVYPYLTEGIIGRLDKIIYYVANTQRYNELGKPVYALYRRNLNKSFNKPVELVEGIEKMRIRLGIKESSSAHISYVQPDKIKKWSDVKSIEINLQLNDGREHRRTWGQVIALRERLE